MLAYGTNFVTYISRVGEQIIIAVRSRNMTDNAAIFTAQGEIDDKK